MKPTIFLLILLLIPVVQASKTDDKAREIYLQTWNDNIYEFNHKPVPMKTYLKTHIGDCAEVAIGDCAEVAIGDCAEVAIGDCAEVAREQIILFQKAKIKARLVHGYTRFLNEYIPEDIHKHDYVEYWNGSWVTQDYGNVRIGRGIW